MTLTREQQLEQALRVLLDQIDFRKGACGPCDMVAQCIPGTVFTLCDEALQCPPQQKFKPSPLD